MGRLAHTGWAGVKRVRVDATDCPVARERLRKLKEVERLVAAGCKRLTAISSQGDREVRVLRVAGPVRQGGAAGAVAEVPPPPLAPGQAVDDAGRGAHPPAARAAPLGGRGQAACPAQPGASAAGAGRREAHRVLAAEAPPHPALRLRGARRTPQAAGLQRQPCAPMGHAAGLARGHPGRPHDAQRGWRHAQGLPRRRSRRPPLLRQDVLQGQLRMRRRLPAAARRRVGRRCRPPHPGGRPAPSSWASSSGPACNWASSCWCCRPAGHSGTAWSRGSTAPSGRSAGTTIGASGTAGP